MRTRPEQGPQLIAQFVYSIPYECGTSYVGETGRPLAMQLCEIRHNLKEGILKKSKLAQHAYKFGTESNSRHR
jgi:hypothetical protein